MKKIIVLITFILSLNLGHTTSSYSKNKLRLSSKKNIEVIFNRKTHFDDLVNLRNKALKENEIVLNFNSLKFNKEGDLISIEITVDCRDGFSGNAQNDNLTNSSRFGFKRNYSGNPSIPFEIGILK